MNQQKSSNASIIMFVFLNNSYSNLYFQSKFIEEHKKEMEIFGKVGYKDSQECLEKYPALVCQETLNFLAAWSFDLPMEEVKQIFSRKIF